jgi:hypothetical protein
VAGFDNVTEDKVGNPFDPTPPQSMGTSTKPGHWATYPGAPPQAFLAQIAFLQSQLNAATTNIANLDAETNTLGVEANSYLHGYLAENAVIAEQNAALVQLKIAVYNLNAQVASCRAHQGKC